MFTIRTPSPSYPHYAIYLQVFKQYFGGTVEDNLSLIQKNNYNLLKCLIELQAALQPSLPTSPLQASPASPQAHP